MHEFVEGLDEDDLFRRSHRRGGRARTIPARSRNTHDAKTEHHE